jgi:septum formation protein
VIPSMGVKAIPRSTLCSVMRRPETMSFGLKSSSAGILDPGFVGRHLANVGGRALSSVGAYQFEGEGIQLFERIEGDYFAIIGLPLLPLLAKLRELEAIDG